jgi:integrase/recombinase XerD
MNDFHDLDLLMEKYKVYLRCERRSSDNTVTTYLRMLTRYAAFVKSGGVGSFLSPEPRELQSYLEGLRDSRNSEHRPKPRTLSLHITTLHVFYTWLAANDHATAEAVRAVLNLDVPKIEETVQFVLSREQMAQLLDAPLRQPKTRYGNGPRHRERDKALLEVLYSTGCRANELADLRLDNLDLKAGAARVKVKGGGERYLFLGRYAVAAILLYLSGNRPYLATSHPDAPWLFLGSFSKNGKLSRGSVHCIVKKYGKMIGLDGEVTPHAIRRSAATHLLMAGADLRSVMEYLGHCAVKTTQKYLRLDPTHLQETHAKYHPHGVNGTPPVNAEAGVQALADSVRWPVEDDRLHNGDELTEQGA